MASESHWFAMNKSWEGQDRLIMIGKEGFADLDEFSEKYQDHLQNHPQKASVCIVSDPQVFTVKHKQRVINSHQAAHRYGGRVMVDHHPQDGAYFVREPQVFNVKQPQPVINSDQAAHRYGGKVIVNHRAK